MRRPFALLLVLGLALGLALPGAGTAQAGATLDAVRKAGVVKCGINPSGTGLSVPDSQGKPQGFDADLCRAMAVALFNDADKAVFVAVSTQARFTGLQSGEFDLLYRTTALTLARDTTLGLTIAVPTVFTGQGFLVKKSLGAKSAKDLNGATICAIQGSEIERNVNDYVAREGMKMTTIAFDSSDTVTSAFYAGRCDAVSNDMISLQTVRLRAPTPGEYVTLPDIIAKEPQGWLVRNGDPEFEKLARWVLFALVQAEEFGLTRANVEAARRDSKDPKVRRFLGLDGNVGKGWDLRDAWAYDVVRAMGNYGEIFDRHLGKGGLGLDRGPNRLWTEGGLMISWLWQ
jgi:general L-amino acid transport system substrate-binding protein